PERQVRGDGGVLVMAVVRGEQVQLEGPARLVGDVLSVEDQATCSITPSSAGTRTGVRPSTSCRRCRPRRVAGSWNGPCASGRSSCHPTCRPRGPPAPRRL